MTEVNAEKAPVTAGGEPSSPPPPRPLQDILMVRMTWKGDCAGKTARGFTLHSIEPQPEWPVGRKGLFIENLWKQQAKPTSEGMLTYDGDVVIDEIDVEVMVHAIASERESVWVAPVRLWPKATGVPTWVWGHRHMLPEGLTLDQAIERWQTDVDDPDMFSFCFTWIPARLMEGAIKAGLKRKIFPEVDMHMWQTARDLGIPVRVVRGDCHPRHLNY